MAKKIGKYKVLVVWILRPKGKIIIQFSFTLVQWNKYSVYEPRGDSSDLRIRERLTVMPPSCTSFTMHVLPRRIRGQTVESKAIKSKLHHFFRITARETVTSKSLVECRLCRKGRRLCRKTHLPK